MHQSARVVNVPTGVQIVRLSLVAGVLGVVLAQLVVGHYVTTQHLTGALFATLAAPLVAIGGAAVLQATRIRRAVALPLVLAVAAATALVSYYLWCQTVVPPVIILVF